MTHREDGDTPDDISNLYREISTEQPSTSADDAILQMAKNASTQQQSALNTAEKKQLAKKTWLQRWSMPVSVAAVVVLSVSIVSVIKDESMRTPNFSEFDSTSKNNLRQNTNQEAKGKPPASLQIPHAEARHDESLPADSNKLLNQAGVTSGLSKDRESPQRSLRKSSVEKEFKTNSDKSNAPIVLESESVQELAAIDKQTSSKTVTSITDAISPIKKPIDKPARKSAQASASFSEPQSLLESQPQALQPQDIVVQPKKTKSKARAKQSLLASDDDSKLTVEDSLPAEGSLFPVEDSSLRAEGSSFPVEDSSFPVEDSESNVTKNKPELLRRSANSGRSDQQISAALTIPVPGSKPSMTNEYCANTSNAKCLTSIQCMLVIGKTGLQCRAAENQCESNFSQLEDKAKSCQQRANCGYRPGKCQCDEEEKCTCGKSGPPLCVPF